MAQKGRKRRNDWSGTHTGERLNDMVEALDEKDALLELREALLPALREDLAKGLSTQDIMAKYEKFAIARTIQIVLTETDSAKALNAAKDLLDRVHGKAVEKKDIQHRLGRLPDKELQAVLASELEEFEDGTEGAD